MLENQEKKFSEYFNRGDNLRLSVQERLRKVYVMETTLDKVNSSELYGSKVISYTPRTTEQLYDPKLVGKTIAELI